MGKNRTRSVSPTNTNPLGNNLEKVDQILNSIYDMSDEEITQLADDLKNNITSHLIEGGSSSAYYELSDGTIIPQHQNLREDLSGRKLLEDWSGDTYQNEYYRQLTQLLNDVEFELGIERGIPYEIEDNPIPDRVIPVVVDE